MIVLRGDLFELPNGETAHVLATENTPAQGHRASVVVLGRLRWISFDDLGRNIGKAPLPKEPKPGNPRQLSLLK